MADIKHTPLPWRHVKANHEYDILGPKQQYIAFTNHMPPAKENAEFIVKACNSYYANQETIRELVEAIDRLVIAASGTNPELGSELKLAMQNAYSAATRGVEAHNRSGEQS